MKIEDLETPCFIVKEEELINNIVNFKSSLNQFFRHNILSYSIKTNSLPFILDVAKKMAVLLKSYHMMNTIWLRSLDLNLKKSFIMVQ